MEVDEYDLDVETAAIAPPNSTCVTIQRGLAGQVWDTDLALGNGANYPMGWYPLMKSGLSTTDHWTAVQFDFSGLVPANKTITLAVFSVYAGWSDQSSTVRAHRVKFPWSELTTTWGNFGGTAAWDPAVLGTFDAVLGGTREVNITALAQGWHSGSIPNYGVLLEEDPIKVHGYMTSESSTPSKRPSLFLCWSNEAPPDEEICGEVGEACDTAADCCDLPCDQGTCGAKPPPDETCGEVGEACTTAADCCDLPCDQGTCGAKPPTCKNVGGSCTTDAQCCGGGTCWDGMCVSMVNACVPIDSGLACSPWSPCCDGGHCISNGAQGVCYDPEWNTCKAPGEACNPFDDFCCWQGKLCGDSGVCE